MQGSANESVWVDAALDSELGAAEDELQVVEDRDMTVDEIKAKVLEHLEQYNSTLGQMLVALGLEPAEERKLDRALQALRREGKIEFVSREWRLV